MRAHLARRTEREFVPMLHRTSDMQLSTMDLAAELLDTMETSLAEMKEAEAAAGAAYSPGQLRRQVQDSLEAAGREKTLSVVFDVVDAVETAGANATDSGVKALGN